MHVALLFPSGTDPRAPHLALPALTAFLRRAGIEVTQRDLDIEGLLWLLEPSRLEAARRTCRRIHDRAPGDQRRELRRLLALGEWVVDGAGQAVRDLRTLERFLDPDIAHQARACIALATELHSVASGNISYSATSAAYDIDGIDATRLDDLVAATADPWNDLFDEYLATEVVPVLDAERPDVVGISILNRQQVLPGLMLARRLRRAGHVVVLGGTVYAKFHAQLLGRPEFFEHFCDALVPYEGETALLAIVEAIDAAGPSADFGSLPNTLALGSDGRVHAGPTHAENIASLPTPDFEGLPLDDYLSPVRVLPILTGKGCYFNRCKFCDIPYINRVAAKPYRSRTPDLIAADIAQLHRRHDGRHFVITDETLSPNLLLKLGDALERQDDFRPRFVGYARFERGFTPQACERIRAMGMRKLFFGLESGSQAMLDHMDKGIDVDVARNVLRNCDAAGLAVHVFSIVGFPEETEAQARETLAFLFDEHASLAHPRNTFDVHPFGLDLRTEYGDNPGRFGIEFDGDPTAGADFPITLRGWRNTNGLSAPDADALIAEFHVALRDRYHGSRNFPDQQWPGFEEYAVVYGDTFDGVDFPWRLSMPPSNDPLRFALKWAPHIKIEDAEHSDVGGALKVHSFDSVVAVSPAAMALLTVARSELALEGTVDEHLDALANHVDPEAGAESVAQTRERLRVVADALIGSRALWLRPATAEP